MTIHLTNQKGHGNALFLSITVLMLSSIAILWAWNTLAVDLFALPQMQFKHGFAVMLTLLATYATLVVFKRAFEKPESATK